MWYQQGHDILLQYWSVPQEFVSCFARNQRKTKKKVITSGGPVISRIFCPISIRECMENKRRLSRVEKTMKESAIRVSKNVQNISIVSRSWSR